jgi:hypothetical protein
MANDKPVCIPAIDPAVAKAEKIVRKTVPIARPMRTSPPTPKNNPVLVSGIGGNLPATNGVIIAATNNANNSRTRGGTELSPIPGANMNIAPNLAKTRPVVQI